MICEKWVRAILDHLNLLHFYRCPIGESLMNQIDWKSRIVVAVVFFVGFIVGISAVTLVAHEPSQLVSLIGGIVGGYVLLFLYKRFNT